MNAPIHFRQANRSDIRRIVSLLADDPLGEQREQLDPSLPESYYAAFFAIDADPNNELVVAELDEQMVGVLQLTFVPGLTYQGGWRAQIEGVRVASDVRSRGIGKALVEWAVDRARRRGCRLVQLTTDKARPEALRFYEDVGFRATHEGLKLLLK